MENASKALLIAAGIFLAIMIVSLLVVLYNDISSYYTQKHEATLIEQTTKFNAKFENYHRNNIRGSDLISLMNKIIDYNATESYFDETNYERIKVTITLGNEEVLEGFKTGYEGKRNQYLMSSVITNTTGDNWVSDKKLIAITNTPSEMCQIASAKLGRITDKELQLLASKIYNIFVTDEEDLDYADDRLYRAYMLEDLLGKNIIEVNEETGKTTDKFSADRLQVIKDITIQYYQYMQFKRAKFDCTEVKYDTETNRIVEMNFKLQTKIENGKEKPVMD
ncbi:MAG: hypothetical protein IJE68_01760 [Clostridia bacterium]|nr:hypothetical protein [Clostridia bacterium]